MLTISYLQSLSCRFHTNVPYYYKSKYGRNSSSSYRIPVLCLQPGHKFTSFIRKKCSTDLYAYTVCTDVHVCFSVLKIGGSL